MRAIFFDLDGTLVELPEDFAGLFEATLADHGVHADPERHEFYIQNFFEHLEACREDPYRAAMADLRAEFGLGPSAEELAESYTEREAAATSLRPGARDALDALGSDNAGSGLALGVLTNGGLRAQHRKLGHHGIADEFEAVVVSGDVGAGKPDTEIFATAKDAIPADEYVFVADDLERDVLPAQDAGFTGIYVGENEGIEENAKSKIDRADATAESLREVPDLLDLPDLSDLSEPSDLPK